MHVDKGGVGQNRIAGIANQNGGIANEKDRAFDDVSRLAAWI
jgi:hypothetical protein